MSASSANSARLVHFAKILIVSDSVSQGASIDKSGPAIKELLESNGFEITTLQVTCDGRQEVAAKLIELCEGFHGLVVTSGGTGMAPRDQTPEATLDVIDKQAPGLAEAMRQVNPLGRLSRAVCGIHNKCLIVNLPGSTNGSLETLGAIIDIIPHALDLMGDSPAPHPLINSSAT